MYSASIQQAKLLLSKLITALEQGQVREVVILRDGRPVAKLVPLVTNTSKSRIGVAKGKFNVPDDINSHNAKIAETTVKMKLGRTN